MNALWFLHFPEHECIKNGDPYLQVIVDADDIICDHRYNFEWFGLDETEAVRTAERVESERLSYELELLYRWWGLTV